MLKLPVFSIFVAVCMVLVVNPGAAKLVTT